MTAANRQSPTLQVGRKSFKNMVAIFELIPGHRFIFRKGGPSWTIVVLRVLLALKPRTVEHWRTEHVQALLSAAGSLVYKFYLSHFEKSRMRKDWKLLTGLPLQCKCPLFSIKTACFGEIDLCLTSALFGHSLFGRCSLGASRHFFVKCAFDFPSQSSSVHQNQTYSKTPSSTSQSLSDA